MIRRIIYTLCLLVLSLVPRLALAQIPETFTNLRVLPDDIERDELMKIMRGFSFALGVRCQHCHAGGDGVSFEGVVFESDDDSDKHKARFMLRMTENLNRQVLPLVPERDNPPSTITCATCHRGVEKPVTLAQELLSIVEAEGADAAVARYRELREHEADRGRWDFGEWETNTVAEALAAAGSTPEAIAIYELNVEYFPDSIAIHWALGQLHEKAGDTASAIARYERVLELRPNHGGSQERLAALRPNTD